MELPELQFNVSTLQTGKGNELDPYGHAEELLTLFRQLVLACGLESLLVGYLMHKNNHILHVEEASSPS